MKVTYADMTNTIMQKNEILEGLKLPIRFGLRMVAGIRKAQEYAADFETIRQGIIKEYDIRQVNDTMPEEEKAEAIAHNEKVLPEANAKIIEALNQSITIDFIPFQLDKFKEEELAKLADIPVKILDATWWMWKVNDE